MNHKHEYDKKTQEILEGLSVPFAVYQYIEKRVVSVALSAGFRKLFGYEDAAEAYHDMDHDMYRDVHPDDAARVAEAAIRFAMEGGEYDAVYRSKSGSADGYRVIHARGEHRMTDSGVCLAYVWYTDEGPYREDDEGTGLSRYLCNALHAEAILRANQYDYLTGLPSMTYFFERAEIARDACIADGIVPVFLYRIMTEGKPVH